MEGNLFATMDMPKPRNMGAVEPKQPEFYTKNWLPIPKSAVSMITAPGGAGKTFFSLQIAAQIIKEKTDRRVLLWLSEDPEGQSRARFDSILSRIMKVSNAKEYLDNVDIVGSDQSTPHITIENLSATEKLFQQYSVIVIDPLIAFYAGDENSNGMARSFMNMFTTLAQRNKISIIFIHHHTKGSAESKSTTRGASAFVDAVRAVYELEIIEDSTERKVNISKDNWGVKMHLKSGSEFTILPFEVVIESEKDIEPKQEKDGREKKSSLWDKI